MFYVHPSIGWRFVRQDLDNLSWKPRDLVAALPPPIKGEKMLQDLLNSTYPIEIFVIQNIQDMWPESETQHA